MLSIKIINGPPHVALALEGELDLTSSAALQAAVEGLNLDETNSITFSLDGLEFIDSTGIGQLLGYYKSFSKRDLPVYIQNENEEIEGVLRLIGVREIMGP
ncbi:MAG: STAS domain-containing protein [Firmicutes bacterium]|nr:STAS domain-containing protein [Bacillota bacterium]